ncbi:hypothetical protein CRENBAI_004190, partial [Crenichthys baileyi]
MKTLLPHERLGSSVLRSFHHCVMESVLCILCTCITVLHGSCTATERKALQRTVFPPPWTSTHLDAG